MIKHFLVEGAFMVYFLIEIKKNSLFLLACMAFSVFNCFSMNKEETRRKLSIFRGCDFGAKLFFGNTPAGKTSGQGVSTGLKESENYQGQEQIIKEKSFTVYKRDDGKIEKQKIEQQGILNKNEAEKSINNGFVCSKCFLELLPDCKARMCLQCLYASFHEKEKKIIIKK